MSETRKTAAFVGIAIVLAVAAWITAPRMKMASVFQERGATFFPEFTDPNSAASLEVVEFDEQTSLAKPFKVLNRDGKWTIPSHYNYPADGQQRLSQTAAAIIALKKDDVASDNVADQEMCGVLDPLDETLPTAAGRGTRVTVKGQNERVLADIIIGKPVEKREQLRYVRIPGQKRTYVAKVGDLPISTNFGDWIERDLLEVDRYDIDSVVIHNYSLDESTGRLNVRDNVIVNSIGRDVWKLDGMTGYEEMNTYNMNLMITKLDDLQIIDVQPKPTGVTATLSRAGGSGGKLLQADVEELATKGFYFTPTGDLVSNEGEVVVHTTSGIFYILRFGEVVYGTPDVVAASAQQGTAKKPTATENRYLFISVGLDPRALKTDGERAQAAKRLELLRTRFAPWYYVIPADSFNKIRLQRKDLVRPKGAGERQLQQQADHPEDENVK